MIHAYDPQGRARCGQQMRNGAPSVHQAFYRDLCPKCLAAIRESCLRRQRP